LSLPKAGAAAGWMMNVIFAWPVPLALEALTSQTNVPAVVGIPEMRFISPAAPRITPGGKLEAVKLVGEFVP
jgi:hypothetical protein